MGVTNQTSGEGFLGEWHSIYSPAGKDPDPRVDAKVPPAWASAWAPLLDTWALKKKDPAGETNHLWAPLMTCTYEDYNSRTQHGSAADAWAILWPWCRVSQAGTECVTGPFDQAASFTLFAVEDIADIDATTDQAYTAATNYDYSLGSAYSYMITRRPGGMFRATERALVANAYSAFRAAVKGQISAGWVPLGSTIERSSLADVRHDYKGAQPYDDPNPQYGVSSHAEPAPWLVDRASGDRNSIRLCQTMALYESTE
eukprot:COSAG01_NODE_311_length_19072_cov_73.511727_10_plen_257_part_00